MRYLEKILIMEKRNNLLFKKRSKSGIFYITVPVTETKFYFGCNFRNFRKYYFNFGKYFNLIISQIIKFKLWGEIN